MFGLKDKNEYRKIVRRKVPPFWSSLFCSGYDKKNFKDIINREIGIDDMIYVGDDIYYGIDEINSFANVSFELWSKNLDEFKRSVDVLNEREVRMEKALFEGKEELFFEYFKQFIPALMLGFSMEAILAKEIKDILNQKIIKSEAEKIFDKLNIPLQDNYYKKAELDLIQNKDIKNHVKKFEWIKSRYGDINPYTVKDAKERLREIDEKEYVFEYNKQKEETKETIKRARDILKKDAHLIDLMQWLVFYRTHRTEVINKMIYYAIPIMQKMAKKNNLSYQEILHCDSAEVFENKIPDIDIIRERIVGCAMLKVDGKFMILAGDEYEKIKEYFKDDIGDIFEIGGSVASTGKTRGEISVIMDYRDFSKFKKGNILVTSMTTPDFVPTMKKSAAIITDEGGITSHAAIISRELKIPCIIGTKIATQVLKDWDLVEVDADNGVVKILKKQDAKLSGIN